MVPSGSKVDTPGLICRLLLIGPENAINLPGMIHEISCKLQDNFIKSRFRKNVGKIKYEKKKDKKS